MPKQGLDFRKSPAYRRHCPIARLCVREHEAPILAALSTRMRVRTMTGFVELEWRFRVSTRGALLIYRNLHGVVIMFS